ILVAVLGVFAVMMWLDAHNAKNAADRAANKAAGGSQQSMAGMPGMSGSGAAGSMTSYAGAAPSNAEALATAHKPFPAAMPPVPAGPIADVNLVLKDV